VNGKREHDRWTTLRDVTKTVETDTYTFDYTFENRVKSVTKNLNTIRSYAFQGDSWMRRTATEDGTTTNYLYDGDSLLAEYDNTLALTAHHAGSGLDRTLWTVRGGNLQTPLSSAQNVMAVADGTGNITDRYRYTAFGERFDLLGNPPNRKDPSFQNRNYDSGLGLYDYRNRSFDPTTGRFLQTDPVDGDDLMNPYTFPGSNPVTNMDPMGTYTYWCKSDCTMQEGGATETSNGSAPKPLPD